MNGEGFLYLGRYYRLKIVDNLEEPLRYENGFFLSRDYLPVAERVFIDYVVVHELVHLEERNHSKAFWEKVKMLMPEYEKHKEWLKKYEYMLRL